MNLLLYILFFLGNSLVADHDFKLSITEVVLPQNEGDTCFVKCYIFHDDLKMALYGRPDADSIITADASGYLDQQLKLQLKDQPVDLHFHSFREKADQVLITFAVADFPKGKTKEVTLQNKILVDQFPGQKNMVYLYDTNGKKQAAMCDTDQSSAHFKL